MTAVADNTRLAPISIIRALIRERIETMGGTDPRGIADILIEEGLSDECQRALVRVGLIYEIRRQNGENRRPPRVASPEASSTSKKWDNVRAARESNPDVFQTSWYSITGPKMLGDFTHEDAVWTHKWYVAQAKGNVDRADRFAKLAKILPPGKSAHSLPREQVEAIFNA